VVESIVSFLVKDGKERKRIQPPANNEKFSTEKKRDPTDLRGKTKRETRGKESRGKSYCFRQSEGERRGAPAKEIVGKKKS